MKAKIKGQINGYIELDDIPVAVKVIEKQMYRQGKGKACLHCGSPFEAERPEAKYCSEACRKKAHYQRSKRSEKNQKNIWKRIMNWLGTKLEDVARKLKE